MPTAEPPPGSPPARPASPAEAGVPLASLPVPAARVAGRRLAQVNAAFLALVGGADAEALLGRALEDLLICGSGDAPASETLLRRSDGSRVPVRVQEAPLGPPDRGDNLLLLTDLSPQRDLEERLQASDARFRSYVEQSIDVIFTLDAQGRFQFVSPAWEHHFGFPARQVLGQPFAPFVHPEDIAPCMAYLGAVLSTGQPGTSPPYRVLHADGSWRWFRANGSVLAGDDGAPGFLGVAHDITAERAAEEALRDSEARYRARFNLASEGIMTIALDGRILDVNDAMVAMHGFTREELLQMRVGELDTPDHRPGIGDRMARLLAGESITFELDHHRKDGSTFPLEISASLVTTGETPVILAFHRDISARRQAETALKASERRLGDILDSVDSYIYIKDRECRYTYVNRKVCGFFGRPREAILGRGDDAFFTGGSLEELRASDLPVLTLGERVAREESLVSPSDGSERTFWSTKVPLRTADGAIYALCGTSTDITARRQAERALGERDAQLRVIFETSDAGIILVSPQGRIELANDGMARLFGRPVSELAGLPYPDLVDPSEHREGEERMRMLIQGEIDSVSLERCYLRGDGTSFWGHLSGRRLTHPDGSLRALVGIITDITARREAQAEQQLLQAQLHQAQKMESLGHLAGGVAHDMNNVLGAILGLASAQVEALPPGSPAQRAMGTIIQAAERGGGMLKGLLSFARQGSGEQRRVDLNTLLRDEVRLLERTTLAKVRLVLELTEPLRPIRGDAGALTHALMNLCVNAVDAMETGGTLTLRTRNASGGWVEAEVEDTGCGMTPEVQARALDPFFTTKEVGRGTGLGLSIVYRTVQAHGGQVALYSTPGQGTRITLAFPSESGGSEPGEAAPARPLDQPDRVLHVLLVDDDELIQASMQGVLQGLGHRATILPSGEAALEQVAAGLRPDVVILDMNMPGLGGAGTLPRLRELLPGVPVLLATGRADQAAHDLATTQPAVILLPKPFGLRDLAAHLGRLAGM